MNDFDQTVAFAMVHGSAAQLCIGRLALFAHDRGDREFADRLADILRTPPEVEDEVAADPSVFRRLDQIVPEPEAAWWWRLNVSLAAEPTYRAAACAAAKARAAN